MKRTWLNTVAAAFAVLVFAAATAHAQVTTGAIGGTITDEAGKPVTDVQIRVTSTSTGFKMGTQSRGNGRYLESPISMSVPPYGLDMRHARIRADHA